MQVNECVCILIKLYIQKQVTSPCLLTLLTVVYLEQSRGVVLTNPLSPCDLLRMLESSVHVLIDVTRVVR